jgi:hypothetical protein
MTFWHLSNVGTIVLSTQEPEYPDKVFVTGEFWLDLRLMKAPRAKGLNNINRHAWHDGGTVASELIYAADVLMFHVSLCEKCISDTPL